MGNEIVCTDVLIETSIYEIACWPSPADTKFYKL
jgi:hypothetical protein